MKTKLLSVAVALALGLGSSAASAFYLPQGSGTTAGAQLEDDDVDFFVDNNGDGLINVGDVLVAPFEIGKVIDILPPIDATQNLNIAADELVGLATVQVISNLGTDPAGRIRFGQFGTTPILQYFQGGVNLDVVTCASQATCVSATTDGTALWAFSITDADTEWFFDPLIAGANSPAAVASLPAATKVGIVNFTLDQVSGTDVFNPQAIGACGFLFQCSVDGLADMVGSADILGGLGLTNGAFARSDADMTVNVPEPATLALLGAGLLGLGAARRRKKA